MIRLKREYAPYHPRTFYFQYSISSIIILSRTSSIFWGVHRLLGEWLVNELFFSIYLAYPWIIQHGWLGNAIHRGMFRCHLGWFLIYRMLTKWRSGIHPWPRPKVRYQLVNKWLVIFSVESCWTIQIFCGWFDSISLHVTYFNLARLGGSILCPVRRRRIWKLDSMRGVDCKGCAAWLLQDIV